MIDINELLILLHFIYTLVANSDCEVSAPSVLIKHGAFCLKGGEPVEHVQFNRCHLSPTLHLLRLLPQDSDATCLFF